MFGVISDTHYHQFSLFAGKTDENGMNERLLCQIETTLEVAKAIKESGGDTLFHGGDMFHVRGNVSPIVLNAVVDCYRKIVQEIGLKVVVIAGNHDLETRDAQFYSNASSALASLGVTIVTDKIQIVDQVVCVGWRDKAKSLLVELDKVMPRESRKNYAVLIHAGLDNVLPHIPKRNLDADDLEALGYGLVMAGHFHNHRQLSENVYSIGALQHHNFGDVGSLAGFLFVTDDLGVCHFETDAPKFLRLEKGIKAEEINGNYVRIDQSFESQEKLDQAKALLVKHGCKGFTGGMVQKMTSDSVAVSEQKLASLGESVSDYAQKFAVENQLDEERLANLCVSFLVED